MSDVNKLITDNIDVWTSAIKKRNSQGRGSNKKIELTGVKKLRELILELAMRGKLVEQDVNDEPASVLFEKIAKEKAQLIKAKKAKDSGKKHPKAPIHQHYSIPKNWLWVDFRDLIWCFRGHNPPKSEFVYEPRNGYIRFVQITDFKTDKSAVYVPESAKNKLVQKGEIIMAAYRHIGKLSRKMEGAFNVALCKINPFEPMNVDFVELLIGSGVVKGELLKASERGHIPSMHSDHLLSLLVPLPPLAEQQRIVAKVDELMALCDQLEQKTEQSLSAHQTLVEVLLAALTKSDSADDFQTSWQRIAEHFDLLFTTEQSIEQLKQTILQLAVMGKLVPQNPSDEPASVLLEKIAEEKAQLIADKKIKKQKLLPAITDEEKAFKLPRGWGLTRLDDICFGITSGSTPPKDKFDDQKGVPYIKVYNIKEQAIAFDYRPQFVDAEHHKDKLTRSILYPGDVVMNIVGPPLGKIAIIPDDFPEWNCNQAIVFFRPIEKTLNSYIYTYLTSGRFLDAIELIGTAGQDNISVTKSRSIIFPMPPLAEQQRIVAKVDELMALCEQLKARLSDAQTTQLHLADAVVENALN